MSRITAEICISSKTLTEEQFTFTGHPNYLSEWTTICKIATAKNTDYSTPEDPLANFLGAEEFGIDPIIGVIIRISDKMQRIKAFCRNGKLAVENESISDTFRDMANYCLLANTLLQEKTK